MGDPPASHGSARAGEFQAQPARRSPCREKHGEGGEAILRDVMASRPESRVGSPEEHGCEAAFPPDSRLQTLQAEACSGKKSATEGGYSRFDTDRNERHHGDALWALALAVRAAGGTGKEARKRRAVQAGVV
jgi:hypothetical protein